MLRCKTFIRVSLPSKQNVKEFQGEHMFNISNCMCENWSSNIYKNDQQIYTQKRLERKQITVLLYY